VQLADLVHHLLIGALAVLVFDLLPIPDAVSDKVWHAVIEPPECKKIPVKTFAVFVRNKVSVAMTI
jgi:hypothetical protein